MIISGNIKDINGPTIPGANIYLSDANGNMLQPVSGTATDIDGNYTLDTKDAQYITATFVGVGRQTKSVYENLPVGGSFQSNRINFVLGTTEGNPLNTAEITAKKPLPWPLIISVSVVIMGMTFFIVKIYKDSK